MKPVARWTIGDVSETGFKILYESVKKFHNIYPEFKKIICYNNINLNKIKHLESYAEFFQQKEIDSLIKLLPSNPNDDHQADGCGWKLCPPRLSCDSHELFIDNDLVILKRIEEIDRWLKCNDKTIISEGHPRSRMFGIFDKHIPDNIRACAGLFGLPPNFDFAKEIIKLKKLTCKPNFLIGGWDEQGLTTAIVTKSDFVLIPLSKVYISEDWVDKPLGNVDYIDYHGIHFVGANRKPWHRGWKFYKKICFQKNKLFI